MVGQGEGRKTGMRRLLSKTGTGNVHLTATLVHSSHSAPATSSVAEAMSALIPLGFHVTRYRIGQGHVAPTDSWEYVRSLRPPSPFPGHISTILNCDLITT